MTSVFIILLIAIDLILIGVVFYVGKRKYNPVDLIREMGEERKALQELRAVIKDDIAQATQKNEKILEKMQTVATEIDLEIKSTGETLADELETALNSMSSRIDEPMEKLNRSRQNLENLLRQVQTEKKLIRKIVDRGEKLLKFFGKNASYEEIIEEIEDKKYSDARALISQGLAPQQVADEVGLSVSEVKLLAGFQP